MFWFSPHLSGFLCLSVAVVAAVIILLWRNAKRVDCPRCGHRNVIHANYCGHCGQQLRQP